MTDLKPIREDALKAAYQAYEGQFDSGGSFTETTSAQDAIRVAILAYINAIENQPVAMDERYKRGYDDGYDAGHDAAKAENQPTESVDAVALALYNLERSRPGSGQMPWSQVLEKFPDTAADYRKKAGVAVAAMPSSMKQDSHQPDEKTDKFCKDLSVLIRDTFGISIHDNTMAMIKTAINEIADLPVVDGERIAPMRESVDREAVLHKVRHKIIDELRIAGMASPHTMDYCNGLSAAFDIVEHNFCNALSKIEGGQS